MSVNNNRALSKAIVSIILSSALGVFFLIYSLSDCFSKLSDAVQYIISFSICLLSVPGVIMAIWAKKSNVEQKTNAKLLSLIGMFEGSINIFLLTLTAFVIPYIFFNQPTSVMADIAPRLIPVSIIIFVVLLIIYFKSKPNKQ